MTDPTPEQPAPLAPVMTPDQVMQWLQVTRRKLADLIDQGMPYRSLSPKGRTRVFCPPEVQAWLDSRKQSRKTTGVPAAEKSKGGRPKKGEASPAKARKWIKM